MNNIEQGLESAMGKWKETKEYTKLKSLLSKLNQAKVTQIVGLGLGSVESYTPTGTDELIKGRHAKAFTQLALVLTIQEELAKCKIIPSLNHF